jgi:phospho-N-acetylmuramoyl-pentapeptide-transferase
MLYFMLTRLVFVDRFFNVFGYITVRAGLAMFTAFVLAVIAGKPTIAWLSRLKFGQVIRDDGPTSHLKKAGTPTMGGVLIVFAVIVATLFWSSFWKPIPIAALFVTLGFGAVGFADDWLKIKQKNTHGLRGKYKIVIEAAIAIAALLFLAATNNLETRVVLPFLKNVRPDLGVLYFVLALIVILGASNAVNLTDGLDGLAIMPVVIVAGTFAVIAYLVARYDAALYLFLPQIRGAEELAVFLAAIVGAGLGFLWFNCHPAQVFMGDVGALSLGAAIGLTAVIVKFEIVLVIAGGIFVAEALSVILQVGYFKMTGGKRLFRMAPLHHHFEQLGWPEEKVIVRFWIVQILLALATLATLKLR